jgi:hypothetical protein
MANSEGLFHLDFDIPLTFEISHLTLITNLGGLRKWSYRNRRLPKNMTSTVAISVGSARGDVPYPLSRS